MSPPYGGFTLVSTKHHVRVRVDYGHRISLENEPLHITRSNLSTKRRAPREAGQTATQSARQHPVPWRDPGRGHARGHRRHPRIPASPHPRIPAANTGHFLKPSSTPAKTAVNDNGSDKARKPGNDGFFLHFESFVLDAHHEIFKANAALRLMARLLHLYRQGHSTSMPM